VLNTPSSPRALQPEWTQSIPGGTESLEGQHASTQAVFMPHVLLLGDLRASSDHVGTRRLSGPGGEGKPPAGTASKLAARTNSPTAPPFSIILQPPRLGVASIQATSNLLSVGPHHQQSSWCKSCHQIVRAQCYIRTAAVSQPHDDGCHCCCVCISALHLLFAVLVFQTAGADQAPLVQQLLEQLQAPAADAADTARTAFVNVAVHADCYGVPRFVSATRSS